jgi:hypothetical protein
VSPVKKSSPVVRGQQQCEKAEGDITKADHAERRRVDLGEEPRNAPQSQGGNSEAANQDCNGWPLHPVKGNAVQLSGRAVVDYETEQNRAEERRLRH